MSEEGHTARGLDPEAPGGYRLEESLGYWVHRLYRTMEREFQRRLAPFSLTPQEWAVLKTCGRAEPTPAKIADKLEMNSSAVTRFLDRLEGKGLVRRLPHPADRRCTTLELTADGKRMVCGAGEQALGLNADVLAALDEDERAAFIARLRRLVEHARSVGM